MKNQIELLIKMGMTPEHAEKFVKSTAEEWFKKGANTYIEYFDDYTNEQIQTHFDEKFALELKKAIYVEPEMQITYGELKGRFGWNKVCTRLDVNEYFFAEGGEGNMQRTITKSEALWLGISESEFDSRK